MESKHRLEELLDKLRQKKGYSIKRVAELLGGEYTYETLRNEKSKKEPSPWVIKKIEEVFKDDLREDAEKAPLKNYAHSTDNPVVNEDQVPYGDKKNTVSKLQLIRKNLVKLTADVDEVLKEIEDSKGENGQVKENISKPEETADTSKPTSTPPTSEEPAE